MEHAEFAMRRFAFVLSLVAVIALLGGLLSQRLAPSAGVVCTDSESIRQPSPRDTIGLWPTPLPDASPWPEYPDSALVAGVTGGVVVGIFISKTGEVKRCQIMREQPEGWGFGAAVERAILQWRFQPATGPWGDPISIQYFMPFRFPSKPSPDLYERHPRTVGGDM